MARKDTERYQSYEKDTYDNPPEGPVGVHRGARPMIVRATPFIIVLVVAVAAGVLFWSIFSGEAANIFNGHSQATSTTTAQTEQASTSSSSASENASESASASETESAQPQETASNTPEESQQVNMGTQVTVINATGVAGYANEQAGVLQSAGFTNVVPANPDMDTILPQQTVVYYKNDADLATAQQVANTLGITTVEQSATIATPIEVVLMQ